MSTCPTCNEEFPNFRALNGHQNKHRGPVQEQKQERAARADEASKEAGRRMVDNLWNRLDAADRRRDG